MHVVFGFEVVIWSRLYQLLTHHQTPELERIYTMGPCRIHYIDNSRKVVPNLTSTAPIATGHWTFIFIKGEQ